MRLTCVLVVMAACLAHAQEPSAPPVMPTEVMPSVPPGFLEGAVKVDAQNQLTEGAAQQPLSHRALFERLGRVDLIARSDSAARRRLWLGISAGVVALAGGVSGAVLLATSPRLSSVECESDVRVYNDVCVPAVQQHTIAGTSLIAAGVVTGVLLATLAWWSDPAVLDRDETSKLVSLYNVQLLRRLKGVPVSVRVVPVVTPQGGLLAATARF